MGLDALGGEGVVIMKVDEGSSAARMQFQPGDIVVSIGTDEIGSVKDFKAATLSARSQWDFAVKRGDRVLKASVGG